jgi:tartrate dehydrogenase/decarboxylase/D-malate dehydrogenase
MRHRIALYPGDGIGQEVVPAAVRVLEQAARLNGGFELELHELDWGLRCWEATGKVVPDDFLDRLRRFDATFLGAVGWPARIPDHVTLDPLKRIRQSFDLYACVRPARLLPGVVCPLAGKGPGDVDLVVIRENSEGEYVDSGSRFRQGTPEECAVQSAIHSRRGVERILRFGFDLARKRRRKLTMATKSNAQRYAYLLWDEVLEELRRQYADVEAERQHADALLMNLVRWPERFDVIVASNLFGDLLTDLTGCIAGGLGLAPSANLQPERRAPSLFEPVHGSAPDIAGQGIANPVAAILSGAMMLDWLGEAAAARRVEAAVERALAAGAATRDLGGGLTTDQMAEAVAERL